MCLCISSLTQGTVACTHLGAEFNSSSDLFLYKEGTAIDSIKFREINLKQKHMHIYSEENPILFIGS